MSRRGYPAAVLPAHFDSLDRRAGLTALGVGLPALALYVTTLMPDVGFWDTAEFQSVGPVLGIAHPTGFPAYTLLAWLASVVFQPFGNEALRANLLAAVLGAGAAGLVGATATLLSGRVIIGIAAGATLAATSYAWSISLHADPHALHIFMAALILLLMVAWSERVADGRPADRWLLTASIAYGVSLANHGLTLLLAPGIGLFVLLVQPTIVRRPAFVAACAAALALTTVALYLYLPIRSAMNPPLDYGNPETWDGLRYLIFAEQFRGEFRVLPDIVSSLRLVIGETFTQLGLLAVLALFGVGVAAARRPALVALLLGWLIVGWVFALGYINADIGRYYLIPLLATVVLGALGAGGLWTALETYWPLSGQQRYVLTGFLGAVLLLTPLAAVPTRHETLDQSHDRLARLWLTTVMQQLPADSVVVSWWSYSTTLWYGKFVEGLRPDVTVYDDSTIETNGMGSPMQVIDSYLGLRPVFLIRLSYDLPEYEARYELSLLPGIIAGEVYRVEGRRG